MFFFCLSLRYGPDIRLLFALKSDPNGWQSNRLKGLKKDYLNAGQTKKELALTAIWAAVVSPLVVKVLMAMVAIAGK